MNILCFGNEHIKEDALAINIANTQKFKGFELIKCHTPDVITEIKQDPLIILDVVKGIKKITIIKDMEQLKEHKISTLHDFDLGFYLKLAKKMKYINKVLIIGLPQEMKLETATIKIKEILKNITTTII